jgi:hypothetical protein
MACVMHMLAAVSLITSLPPKCSAVRLCCAPADVVGQKATALARLFGFEVPPSTKVLIGEATEIGRGEPMSFEKLCPVLGECRPRLQGADGGNLYCRFANHSYQWTLDTSNVGIT